jgi:hypothetical protein
MISFHISTKVLHDKVLYEFLIDPCTYRTQFIIGACLESVCYCRVRVGVLAFLALFDSCWRFWPKNDLKENTNSEIFLRSFSLSTLFLTILHLD